MTYTLDDTIAAIASPQGGAARGVVRASGAEVRQCLAGVFEADGDLALDQVARPTRISGRLRLAAPPRELPCDLLYWPGRRSYTREPLAELHTLGSPPLVEAALRALCAAGARVARPGEFTLRAFLAGRLDLTQAEAVLGVIDADDGVQLRVALAQLAGGLASPLRQLRDGLIDLLAELEAGLDFVEEDIEFVSHAELRSKLERTIASVAELETQMVSRTVAGELPTVVLCGAPNVGKSSLYNALVRGADAIIADAAGTTRDYLAAQLDLGAVRCLLVDTAGLEWRTIGNPLERAAQDGTKRQRESADIELFCIDATRPADACEQAQLAQPLAPATRRITLLTKVDQVADCEKDLKLDTDSIATSSVTGIGLDALRVRLARELSDAATTSHTVVAATASRCRESLRRAREALERALAISVDQSGEELIAAELRAALDELGQVVGTVYTDDILDRIFSRFCIGK